MSRGDSQRRATSQRRRCSMPLIRRWYGDNKLETFSAYLVCEDQPRVIKDFPYIDQSALGDAYNCERTMVYIT
jgi:hypothetical protein